MIIDTNNLPDWLKNLIHTSFDKETEVKKQQTTSNPIRDEFVNANNQIKESTEDIFDDDFGKHVDVNVGGFNNKLDEGTMNVIRKIHSYGSKERFLEAIREVVESRQNVERDVNDNKLDRDYLI